jgi:ABC-type lipoprotein export system ATPase subunit
MAQSLVHCDNLVKIYKVADLEVVALQGLDLDVESGEMLAIVGASGSGKTTLLNILGGLDAPSAGRCVVAGNDLTRLDENTRVRYRQRVVGQVWQQSGRNLLPELSAANNVALPLVLTNVGPAERAARAQELLERVGLGKMGQNRPDALSGGEQQRLAIAIALANRPVLLLADEPTGELDSVTAAEILALLRQLNQQLGLTIILVTHDVAIAAEMDRTLAIRDGRTSTETIRREAPVVAPDAHALASSAIIGLPSETHQESIVIDRVGRLQLPKEALERLPFQGRAQVRILGDHVELWPAASSENGAADDVSAADKPARRHKQPGKQPS